MRSRALARLWFTCLALGAGAAACARDADVGRLRAWDLPAYTLIAADREDPAPYVERMANVERALSKMLATPVRQHGIPTSVWLVPPRIWKEYLAPSRNIVGEFVPRRFGNFLILRSQLTRAEIKNGLQHEYTHFFLRTQFGGLYPLWFDEGMAELMTEARFGPGYASIELPQYHLGSSWVPMARLFVIDKDSPEYLDEQTTAVHRESWALVHRGLIAETAFGGKMFAYLSAINRLMPVEDAAQDSFGMTFPQLDLDMQKYLDSKLFAIARLPYDPAPPVRMPAGRRLGDAEALEKLAGVMLDTGFKRTHVSEIIDAAEKLEPAAPSLDVLRLRVAVRDWKDTEMLRLADSLQSRDDAAIQRGVALALFERVREEQAGDRLPAAEKARLAQRAFGLLDRALGADPGDAECAWAFGLLAARSQESLDVALARLALANTRLPLHPNLAEATVRVLEARGDDAALMPPLLVALRYTSSAEQRAWAAKRIQELRATLREHAPQ